MSNEQPESSMPQGTTRPEGQRGSTVAPGEHPDSRPDRPAQPRHRIEEDIETAERDVGGDSEPT
ncbi:MAG TPA: hypothetical protein VIX87_03005 [Steroidobacteraceae bacterium]